MRKPTWGPVVQQRVKSFIEALLTEANQFYEGKDLLFRWEDSPKPKLVVETKRRCLERLTALNRNQIYEAIESLKILNILDDNRTQTQGKEDWHFTLKLWSKELANNLRQFDRAWASQRSEKSKVKIPVLPEVECQPLVWHNLIPIAVSLGYGNYSQLIPPRYPNS